MDYAEACVHLIDDDAMVRDCVRAAVVSAGLKFVSYGSAEEFLSSYSQHAAGPSCALVDVRLPGISGLALQEKMAQIGCHIPIIMITGYATVPFVVAAMKAGADDFLEKPFHRQLLLERVQKALDRHAGVLRNEAEHDHQDERAALLTTREREVMQLLIDGQSSKEIAASLAISVKTIAKHRARVLEKMEAENVVDLARRLSRPPSSATRNGS